MCVSVTTPSEFSLVLAKQLPSELHVIDAQPLQLISLRDVSDLIVVLTSSVEIWYALSYFSFGLSPFKSHKKACPFSPPLTRRIFYQSLYHGKRTKTFKRNFGLIWKVRCMFWYLARLIWEDWNLFSRNLWANEIKQYPTYSNTNKEVVGNIIRKGIRWIYVAMI